MNDMEPAPIVAPRRNGRFLNPDGSAPGQSFGNLWKLMRSGKGSPWPRWIVDPPEAPPPSQVAAGHAGVSFIGHSTFLIRLDDGTTVLTDPIFSDRCSPFTFAGPKRVRAPAIALAALPPIDIVLLSHNHYDHLDITSLRQLHALHRPQIVTGLGNADFLAKRGIPGAIELDWWQSVTLPGGHEATFLPSRHFAARWLHDRCRTLWGGFALKPKGGGALYFAGDTAYGVHLAEIGRRAGPFGLALLPIGAYEPRWFMEVVHTTPEEALAAMHDVRASRAIAMHFGTFQLTQEPIDEPPQRLAAALAAEGLPPASFQVPRFGQSLVMPLLP